MAFLHARNDERHLGLPLSSPSYNPLQSSGGSGANQGDSQHRHSKVWIARVVAGPEGELVARPTNDDRFVPTADQAILGKDEVAGLDGGPSLRKVSQEWGASVLTGFAPWIDGGDDLLVQVFPDWRDHRWTGRMDLASW
jgi:hypothetical protein